MAERRAQVPETPATQFLKKKRIEFGAHPYDYVEHGGTSPFATRKAMPVYVEASVLELQRIYINGGRRGFLVSIDPGVPTWALGVQPVNCALVDCAPG